MTVSFNPVQPAFGMALGRKSREATSDSKWSYDVKLDTEDIQKRISVEDFALAERQAYHYFTSGNQRYANILKTFDSTLRFLLPDAEGHKTQLRSAGTGFLSSIELRNPLQRAGTEDCLGKLSQEERQAVAEMMLAQAEAALEKAPASVIIAAAKLLEALPYQITPEVDELLATALKRIKPGAHVSDQEQWKFRMAIGMRAPQPEGEETLTRARTFVKEAWGELL